MNPARAMGTFLRVWREEWAGLSRGQVAIAVSAHAPKAKVTKHVVRAWEEGQPPHTTEELEALLLVMQVHGLSPTEAGQVRQAVLAACCSQRYPELFGDESFAYREDVDQLAAAESTDTLTLATRAYELEQAVLRGGGATVDRRQARRQEVALVHLRHWLGWAHIYAGRFTCAAACCAANGGFLAAYFGPRGLGGDLSVLGQRVQQARMAIFAATWPDDRSTAEAEAWVRELLGLKEEARAKGEEAPAAWALAVAFVSARLLTAPETLRLMAECDERYGSEPSHEGPRAQMLDAAKTLGLMDRAEQCLEALERGWKYASPVYWWSESADWAFVTGRHSEALEHAQRALDAARQSGKWSMVQKMTFRLQKYERAAHASRTISIGRAGVVAVAQTVGGE